MMASLATTTSPSSNDTTPSNNNSNDDGGNTTSSSCSPKNVDSSVAAAIGASRTESSALTPPLSSDGEELSGVEISRLMREQDADLLESMHYASSQVSQYSPGGTPVLRPADRSLPHDELPMIALPAAMSPAPQELIMCSRQSSVGSTMNDGNSNNVNNSSRPSSSSMSLSADFRGFNNSANKTSPQHQGDLTAASSPSLQALSASIALRRVKSRDPIENNKVQLFRDNSQLGQELKLSPSTEAINDSSPTIPPKTKPGIFRRCLSGDIYTVEPVAAEVEEEEEEGQAAENAEEETTASPVSVVQEAATSVTTGASPSNNDSDNNNNATVVVEEDSGKAQQRRMSEALQFAEAVGERIPVSQDRLHIIEDGTDDDDSDDDHENEQQQQSREHLPSNKEVAETSSLHHESSHRHLRKSYGLPPEEDVNKIKQDVPPKLVDVHEPPEKEHAPPKRKSRPTWPFGPAGKESMFLDHLNDGLDHNDFEYKGICANPPEITKRGIGRGNYALLHRKAWLEVSDKYHRYGKNLRLYYRYWERLGFPTNSFFEWLDSKGEAAGEPLPNLDECPRSVLDADTVLYITNPEITEKYALNIVCSEEGRGRLVDVDGDPVLTGSEGWIFILRDNVMYGAKKVTSLSGHSKQRFHHSSFFGGKAVASAGIAITDDDGYLIRLYPHSGHYRPTESHMQRMLFFLHRKGVALRTFEMDTQQFRHVARDKDIKGNKEKEKKPIKVVVGEETNGDKKSNTDTTATATATTKDSGSEKGEKKAKKVDNLHLEKAVHVACFLSHKASFIGEGIFDCIHKIRKADVASVSEALDTVDDGGYWPKNIAKGNGNNNTVNGNGGSTTDTTSSVVVKEEKGLN